MPRPCRLLHSPEAVLQQRIHDFRLSGELFRIIEVEAKQAGSLRESYGDLAPIVAASRRWRCSSLSIT